MEVFIDAANHFDYELIYYILDFGLLTKGNENSWLDNAFHNAPFNAAIHAVHPGIFAHLFSHEIYTLFIHSSALTLANLITKELAKTG